MRNTRMERVQIHFGKYEDEDGTQALIHVINPATGEHVDYFTTVAALSAQCREFLNDDMKPATLPVKEE
jgi:hypothetical protein